jgi:hypothetical protein
VVYNLASRFVVGRLGFASPMAVSRRGRELLLRFASGGRLDDGSLGSRSCFLGGGCRRSRPATVVACRVFVLLLCSFLDGSGLGGFFGGYLAVTVLLLWISCSTVEVIGLVPSSGSCTGWPVAHPLLVCSSAAAEDAVGEDPLLGFCVRLVELVTGDGRFGFGSPEVSSVMADLILPRSILAVLSPCLGTQRQGWPVEGAPELFVLFPYFCEREGLCDGIPDGGGWWVAGSSVLRPAALDLGLFLLLRAPTLKLLMFFQGFRCVLSVVSRRWLL